MKYQQWDKKTDVNGKAALELIGEEQIKNDDPFIIFTDDTGAFLSLESFETLRAIYKFQGETIDEIAYEYIQMKQNEKPVLTPEEQLILLQAQVLEAQKAIAELALA